MSNYKFNHTSRLLIIIITPKSCPLKSSLWAIKNVIPCVWLYRSEHKRSPIIINAIIAFGTGGRYSSLSIKRVRNYNNVNKVRIKFVSEKCASLLRPLLR